MVIFYIQFYVIYLIHQSIANIVLNTSFFFLQINEKKMNNKNYNMKKKDVFVIFINLLVLTLVVYTYYTVNNLNTVLSKTSELCVLKTSSNVIFKDNVDDSKMTNENVRIRRTRSTNVLKCNFIYFKILFL